MLTSAAHTAGMVSPNDGRKLAWDWLVVCFVVYTTLATPLDLAFFDTECSQSGASVRTTARGSQSRPLCLTLTDSCLFRRRLLCRCSSR